ncbi:MAG: dCTP deaminase [Endomicrobiales bacterium]|nr:dCTP deaminase [Endomicrobiales bacterium]
MVMPDSWIIKMALENKMIEPFSQEQVKRGISFGVSSYGYDMRVGTNFKVYQPISKDAVIDPKDSSSANFKEIKTDNFILLEPNSYALAQSVEYFRIPRDILTICFGKSTYARCGVFVNVTPFEPEWEGFVTISIVNTSPSPVKVYANEGIAQVLFLHASEICSVSYADKKGKYQAQKNITHSKI